MDEERDPNAAWDFDPLKVGDRVRIRLTGECRWHVGTSNALPDGHAGVIDSVWREEDLDQKKGHSYRVMFDPPIAIGNSRLLSDVFARVELERL